MFKFRFESLIAIRDNTLKEKQAELAEAYAAQRLVSERKSNIERELAENLESGREKIRQTAVCVDFLLNLRYHETRLRQQLRQAAEELDRLTLEVERCRGEVLEANKELKTLEKLKEKQLEQYNSEQKRKETGLLDEIGSQKHYSSPASRTAG